MTRRLYNRFIKPTSKDSYQAEREVVLNFLLVGLFVLAVIALIDTIAAPLISGEPFNASRVFNNIVAVVVIASFYALTRRGRGHRFVAVGLTLLIALCACSMVYYWGLLLPAGILLCGIAIVIAGILVNARSALYMAGGITLVLVILQYAKTQDYIHPNLTWMRTSSTAGDVVGYVAMFSTIALLSWLFNRQMELSLKRARRSEKALQRQKDLLEVKVEKRARQLEEAQLDKMQQLYRFAELGQLSTALFHDLANHLSTVNLDVEVLPANNNPDITRRIQQNVGHINDIVRRVRRQLGGKRYIETLNVNNEIGEVVKMLAPTAERAGVGIIMKHDVKNSAVTKGPLLLKGDAVRFRQIILNLINNGIESYDVSAGAAGRAPKTPPAVSRRTVELRVRRQGTKLVIDVADHGAGMRPSVQAKIFEPFYTTKKLGIGIGLFMVKQIVENDFGGSIEITSNKPAGIVFSIQLPRSYYARVKAV